MAKLVAAIAMLVSPAIGIPCSVVPDTSPFGQQVMNAFCSSDVVFVGRVIGQAQLGQHVVEHAIRPIRGYKGIRTGRNVALKHVLTAGTSCDIQYTEDESYLFFADIDSSSGRILPGRLTLPLVSASRTRQEVERFAKDLRVCESAESSTRHHLVPILLRKALQQEIREGFSDDQER